MLGGLISTTVNARSETSRCHRLMRRSSALMNVSRSLLSAMLFTWYVCALAYARRQRAVSTGSALATCARRLHGHDMHDGHHSAVKPACNTAVYAKHNLPWSRGPPEQGQGAIILLGNAEASEYIIVSRPKVGTFGTRSAVPSFCSVSPASFFAGFSALNAGGAASGGPLFQRRVSSGTHQ